MSVLDEYFQISASGSSLRKELVAGLTSFVSVSYILIVNPKILAPVFPVFSVGGESDNSNQIIPTAIPSAVATIMLGLSCNKPIIAAPGLGLSSYVTYSLVLANVLSTTEAFTASLLSGAVCLIFAIMGYSDGALSRLVPVDVKRGIVVGMGLLIAMIGFSTIGLISKSTQPDVIIELTKDFTPAIILGVVSILFVSTLILYDVRGGLLIGMTLTTLISWGVVEGCAPPNSAFSLPTIHFESLGAVIDLSQTSLKLLPAIVSFTAVSIFDVGGVMYGFNKLLSNDDNKNTNVFIVCAIGTIISALLGGSPIICAIEGAAGITAGGRTGLVSVVVGLCFFLSLFVSPILVAIPSAATGPVLVCIGALMLKEISEIDMRRFDRYFPAFLTIVMMPFTYSISNGIWAGFITSMYFTTVDKVVGNFGWRARGYSVLADDTDTPSSP